MRVKSLRVQITPQAGESLLSLVARAAHKNVFEQPSQVLKFAGIKSAAPWFLPFTVAEHAEDIALLLSLDVAEIRARMHPSVTQPGMVELIDWYGTPLPRRFIEASARRYSPATMASSPYHQAISMLRPLQFCPLSMEYLRSSCMQCQRALGWSKTRGIDFCEYCNKHLGGPAERSVPHELHQGLRDATALVSTNAELRKEALSKFPAPFRQWEAGIVFAALIELGAMAAQSADDASPAVWPTSGNDFSRIEPIHVAEGQRILADWPNSLQTIVRKVATAAAERGATDGQLAFLGPFKKYFLRKTFDDGTSERPLNSLLVSEITEIVQTLALPIRSYGGAQRFQFRSDKVITASEAAHEFGVAFKILKRLDSGGDSVISRVKYDRGVKIYDPEKLRSSLELYRARISSYKTGSAVGLPDYTLPTLADAGMIAAITDKDALLMARVAMLFEKKSVEAFVASFDDLTGQHPHAAVSLYEAVGHRRIEREIWAKLFSALSAREIVCLGINDSARGLTKRLLVDRDRITGFIKEIPSQPLPDLEVTSIAAEWILAASPEFVSAAIRNRLLPARRVRQNIMIPLAAIAELHDRYISPKEIARVLGVSLQSVSRHRATILNVLPIEPQSPKFLLWRRDELDRPEFIHARIAPADSHDYSNDIRAPSVRRTVSPNLEMDRPRAPQPA
jgi:hypothetical protein